MNAFERRIERLEERLGMKHQRYMFICNVCVGDAVEVLPPSSRGWDGRYAYVYGEPLTADELEEYRVKFAAERKQQADAEQNSQ
jgi:hypothetical protein